MVFGYRPYHALSRAASFFSRQLQLIKDSVHTGLTRSPVTCRLNMLTQFFERRIRALLHELSNNLLLGRINT